MSTEKMREEFEEWVRSEWPDTYLDRVPFGEGRKLEGCYCEVYVQMSWSVWQASRAAIEVKEPDDFTTGGNPNARILIAHHREIVKRWIYAIESHGLKVRP